MDDALARRIILASTVLAMAAGAVASYRIDRSLERWWHENNPFADVRRSVERARAGYDRKRDTATDVAIVLGAIAGGVIGAIVDGDDQRSS